MKLIMSNRTWGSLRCGCRRSGGRCRWKHWEKWILSSRCSSCCCREYREMWERSRGCSCRRVYRILDGGHGPSRSVLLEMRSHGVHLVVLSRGGCRLSHGRPSCCGALEPDPFVANHINICVLFNVSFHCPSAMREPAAGLTVLSSVFNFALLLGRFRFSPAVVMMVMMDDGLPRFALAFVNNRFTLSSSAACRKKKKGFQPESRFSCVEFGSATSGF